ncbi:hypothetical protein JD844_030879 [Phrynosoma platyrhinos]|uniref:IRS-type PTB domain-containing protein n=1 Tax=Phrynosoma platyrhinos TaxID=52577 RepID=A0ABQ7SZU2_PHRPL|nr:hypothetical protein JD844_030879 [Phrynosoma platyrhinos]
MEEAVVKKGVLYLYQQQTFRKRNSELEKERLEDEAPASLAMAENPLYSPMRKGAYHRFSSSILSSLGNLLGPERERPSLSCPLTPAPKVVFSFEAGRRCPSGEGSFEFVTPHGKEIIQLIEEAINARWGPSPRASSGVATLPPGATNRNIPEGAMWDFKVSAPDKGQPASLTTATTTLLSLEPNWRGKPGKDSPISAAGSAPLPTLPRHLSDSFLRRDPQGGPAVSEGPGKTAVVAGSESAEPLDAAHKPPANSSASWPLRDKEQVPSPSLSDGGIQGPGLAPACLGPEHIYDDPELLVHEVYDEPQELKGEAWKLRATAEDPVGHEYPYNPCLDDYSVPKMAAAPAPFQLPGKGRKGLGQAACGHRLLGFKMAKDAQ